MSTRFTRDRCRVFGPAWASPSTPWPAISTIASRSGFEKRCASSRATATTTGATGLSKERNASDDRDASDDSIASGTESTDQVSPSRDDLRRDVELAQGAPHGPDRARAGFEAHDRSGREDDRRRVRVLELDRRGAGEHEEDLVGLDVAHRSGRHPTLRP